MRLYITIEWSKEKKPLKVMQKNLRYKHSSEQYGKLCTGMIISFMNLRNNVMVEEHLPYPFYDTVYATMQQMIIDPVDPHAMVISGRIGSGKTTLLQHANHILDDTIIVVFQDMNQIPSSDFSTWLKQVVVATIEQLENYNLNHERIPQIQEDMSITIEWIREIFLPNIMKTIRSHRYLVWLWDDATYWIDALENKQWNKEHSETLAQILKDFPQLRLVLTIQPSDETRLNILTPLVDITRIQRIGLLSEELSRSYLQEYIGHLNDEHIRQIIKFAGGDLTLLSYIQEHPPQPNTHELDQWYQAILKMSESHLKSIWQMLTNEEQWVMHGINEAIYRDPIKNITAKDVELWLASSDYPLDLIAINATLRGLEYHELITNTESGLRFTSNIWQLWLLNREFPSTSDNQNIRTSMNWQINIIIVSAILIVLIIGIVSLTQQPNPINTIDIQPTVTLSDSN